MSSAAKDRAVPASTSSVLLLTKNEARQGFTVMNTSTSVLFIRWNAAPTSTLHTVRMPPNWYYEVPFHFTGSLYGIWESVNGQAIVTEVP